jgi:uncharacterized protein
LNSLKTLPPILFGEVLLPGAATGPVLSLVEPLSFWGGFNATSGAVIDRRHPQCDIILSGRIVIMTAARGSSSGSSVLGEAIRLGTAPHAFIVAERDAILVVGAMVALELYGLACPIVRVNPTELHQLRTARSLSVDATGNTAQITRLLQ